jgi:two-component system sensor histidine kinase SenX3
MDSTWLVLLSLALGLVIGAGIVTLLHVAAGHGERAAGVVNPAVPDGVGQVLDALDSAGVVLDPSNNVVKASPGALGLGLVWNNALVHSELVRMVDDARTTGESTTRDVELARGPFGDANITLSVQVARLGTRYILLLAEDRTESIRLEAVRRDFVANISHELKTPIGAVSLLSEALEMAADDPQQVKRFAQRLGEESARLARITQDIIDLSRLQATDAVANASYLSIDQIVCLAIDQNRVAADARGIELATSTSSGAQVFGDESLLVVSVHNLVSNAIRYSPDGSRIGVGVRTVDDVVEISVTDQGEGIPEEDLDRVFERFYRVDQARARNTGGTGLGLAIVKHAIQNHGGDVRVWSQPGRGSTFTIRLPQADTNTTSAEQRGVQQP